MTRATTARLRVLSVEDEVLNRMLLRAIFEGSDDERLRAAELVEATTLADARRLALKSHFDLILLDRRLPDGDGLELARELLAASSAARPLIVALTADAVPQTRQAAAQVGCAAILTKPYRPAELVSLIASLLDTPAS